MKNSLIVSLKEYLLHQLTFEPNLFLSGYEHSNGMNQFIVWTALATEGLGCNLQHYHDQPNICKRVAETWDIPESWTLRAQLVFGTATGPPRGGVDKEFANVDDRIKVVGAKN